MQTDVFSERARRDLVLMKGGNPGTIGMRYGDVNAYLGIYADTLLRTHLVLFSSLAPSGKPHIHSPIPLVRD